MGLQLCDPCGLPGAAPDNRSTVVAARLRACGCWQVGPEQAVMAVQRACLAEKRRLEAGWALNGASLW